MLSRPICFIHNTCRIKSNNVNKGEFAFFFFIAPTGAVLPPPLLMVGGIVVLNALSFYVSWNCRWRLLSLCRLQRSGQVAVGCRGGLHGEDGRSQRHWHRPRLWAHRHRTAARKDYERRHECLLTLLLRCYKAFVISLLLCSEREQKNSLLMRWCGLLGVHTAYLIYVASRLIIHIVLQMGCIDSAIS